ncbi:hypothetical protein MMYC01_204072 [Madurella mycetomatis]|uniref:DNA repair protein Rad26 n=1 Tax=Madurella mycetomatis TaxID=100816 RepID=A0A175W767_9PEZI|nr:hypothetical protein MMYC01_204072 [Madurella mycetomatis]
MDEFSDDGFDDLNDTILEELENHAVQFTQAQKHALSQATHATQVQHNALEYDFDDDDLDDTVVIDEHAQLPPRPAIERTLPIQQPRQGTEPRWNQHMPSRPPYPPPQQYPRPIPQPLPSQRYPLSSARPHLPAQPSQFARPPPPVPRSYSLQPSQAVHAGPGGQSDIIAALQARVYTLESDIIAAKGEAAILRSKFDKAQMTHDAEIARLKKQNAEQIAKQERIAEAARAAERTAATELQFARQDLREELGRAKTRRKDGPSTPKKNKTFGLADGFDGVEILSSPTKGQTMRRKDSGPAPDRTPTKGKRKRPVVDSPTFALETHSGEAAHDSAHPNALSIPSRPGPLAFDFLRLVLDHCALRDQPPTFDLFSRFAFPSEPAQTFASTIFHKLPQLGDPTQPLRVLVDFSDLVIDMWQRCLSERYHAPIYYLVALVLYTLELNAAAVAPHIISSLVPVCTTTCRLVALPRFNRPDGSTSDDNIVRQLDLDIDVTQCLSLLCLAALGCPSLPFDSETTEAPGSPRVEFWKTVELDFVLMMLSPKHPEMDWFGMLSLLWTSVTPLSIGPIPSATNASGRAEAKTPQLVAATVIDCVSSFLCEPPRWAPPGSVKELVVRSAALETLTVFATSPFGAFQLADSDVAIPRVVTVLSWAVDRLYDMDATTPLRKAAEHQMGTSGETKRGEDMDVDQLGPNPAEMQVDRDQQKQSVDDDEAADIGEDLEPDPVSLLCRLISRAVRLLHLLATDRRTAEVANISTKLAASHGGSQRHLLALARLNFAEEDLVMEAGVDAETVELAHELLEPAVTPDEGEEVGEVFGD